MKLHSYDVIRKILKFLRRQNEVKKARVFGGIILKISFNDGFNERWCYRLHYKSKTDDLDVDDYPFNNEFPQKHLQFAANSLDPEHHKLSQHFIYTYQYINKFKFCNRRVFIHRLAKQLADEGYVNIWSPKSYKNSMLKFVRGGLVNYDGYSYMEKPSLFHKAKYVYMLSDYFDHNIISAYWNNHNLYLAISKLYKLKRAITRMSIVTMMDTLGILNMNFGPLTSFSRLWLDNFGRTNMYNVTNNKWLNVAAEICGIRHDDENGVMVTDNIYLAKPPFIYMGEMDTINPIYIGWYVNKIPLTIVQTY